MKILIVIQSIVIFSLVAFIYMGKSIKYYKSTHVVFDRNPENLENGTRLKFYKLRLLAAENGIDFIVTCTRRTQQQQDKLYEQGRTTIGTKVTWTKDSKHITGRAFDVAIIKNGKITWNPQDYSMLGLLSAQVGLQWGKAKEPRDYEHFEEPDTDSIVYTQ